MGIIFVYSINNRKSFEYIKQNFSYIKISDNIPLVLVGNKYDLKEKREISKEEGRQLAEEYNMYFFECSAKNYIKINEIFQILMKKNKQKEKGNIYKVEKYKKKDGYGKMIYMNGEIYEGYWKNNLREGKGKLYFINGYYDCNWVNDYQNGIGKIYFNDNSILKVKFINGKKEGKGILLIDNNTINLNFKNDVLIDGIGIIKYENGIKVIYTYDKDFYLIKKN